jgi:hypothetical protein
VEYCEPNDAIDWLDRVVLCPNELFAWLDDVGDEKRELVVRDTAGELRKDDNLGGVLLDDDLIEVLLDDILTVLAVILLVLVREVAPHQGLNSIPGLHSTAAAPKWKSALWVSSCCRRDASG